MFFFFFLRGAETEVHKQLLASSCWKNCILAAQQPLSQTIKKMLNPILQTTFTAKGALSAGSSNQEHSKFIYHTTQAAWKKKREAILHIYFLHSSAGRIAGPSLRELTTLIPESQQMN